MAKTDVTRQSTELTEEQSRAVMLALSGATDESIAATVGVSRQTVNQWRNSNALFMARLNTERAALIESARAELRGALTEAVEVVRDALTLGNAALKLRAAMWLLESAGVFAGMADGETDPADIQSAMNQRALGRLLARDGV